jgi:oxygen-dependent protoporphyrinogen oxidase
VTRLVVVGGGIAGLAAAWEGVGRDGVEVVLVERTDRLGGKVRTSSLDLPGGPLPVDEGADAFLLRVPDALDLCRELGIDRRLVHPSTGRARVYVRGELHPFPAQHVLGVPLDADDLAATGILSPAGLAAVAAERVTGGDPPDGDVAIGPWLAGRFGRELVDHVVGPLVGGINAGDVDRLSMAAVTPQLADAAADGGSLTEALLRRRAAAPAPGPVFGAPPGGMSELVDELARQCRDRGATVLLRSGVEAVRDADRAVDRAATVVVTDEGGGRRTIDADAVVVATGARPAAELVRTVSGAAARELDAIEHCTVALVTLAYDRADVGDPMDGSGFLVPRDAGLLLTAASWGSRKWAHWDDGRHVVLRVSAGHAGDDRAGELDDDELLAGLRRDLVTTMGIDAPPLVTRVARYPDGFAQYTVGHLARCDRIDAALRHDAPAVRVAGAALRGVGIPACIRQGRQAVRDLLGD